MLEMEVHILLVCAQLSSADSILRLTVRSDNLTLVPEIEGAASIE